MDDTQTLRAHAGSQMLLCDDQTGAHRMDKHEVTQNEEHVASTTVKLVGTVCTGDSKKGYVGVFQFDMPHVVDMIGAAT